MNHISKLSVLFLLLSFIFAACSQPAIQTSQVQLPEADDEKPAQEDGPVIDPAVAKGLPLGVMTSGSTDSVLKLFDLAGVETGQIPVPGATDLYPEDVHATSPSMGGSPPSVVYKTWDPSQAIMLASGGSAAALRETTSFLGMAGAAGQPAFAFSEALFEEQGLRSFLYAVTLENAGSAAPFYELSHDPTGMALKPVGMEAVSGMPQGVWYTKTAWGIGGVDLIFPITRGLYFFDLTTGDNLQVVDPEQDFQGISPDLSFAASVEFDMEGDKTMKVHQLENGAVIKFPLNPASDRGAGFAVFSPDNRFVSWMEGEGSWMPDPPTFKSRVRIGEITSGGVVQEIDSTTAADIIEWNQLGRFVPVGWIDNSNVLIEARSDNWDQAALMKYNSKTGGLSYFCSGSFAAFVY